MEKTEKYRKSDIIKPEVQWLGDGVVQVDLFLPTDKRHAKYAALEFAKHMNLKDPEVIHVEVLHPSEGTRVQFKGVLDFEVDLSKLEIPPEPVLLDYDEIREYVKNRPIKVVAGTMGEDEHSVGLREVLDIKHGGIEKYGIEVVYLGTSVKVEKIIDAAIEENADVILGSTIISHDDVHYKIMKRLHEVAIEKGIRENVIICAGGTQVTPEIAVEQGIDAGFGRESHGVDVATFIVEELRRREK